jgi:uncharacterized DUF497 family protein
LEDVESFSIHSKRNFYVRDIFERISSQPLIVRADTKHSMQEPCYCTLGPTDQERLLFLAFAVRRTRVRIISALEMTRKERKWTCPHF